MPDALRTLVILTAYDPGLPGERTLYFTHGEGFTTGPSETPANTTFAAALDEPLNIRRRLQGVGRVSPSLGEIRIANADGAYDVLTGYAFDGRAITVRQGPWTGDYPTDYPVVFTGTVDRVDVTRDYLLVRVRDGVAALQEPLQTVAYDGDNVPPDGLEGEADLEGATKPLAFGSVRNVPLTLVNAQKLIYQVSDSECESISAIRDSGVTLGKAAQGSVAEVSTLDGSDVLSGIFVESLGLYVAVTRGGNSVAALTGRIFTSSDLSTWTERLVNTSGILLNDVAFNPVDGILCAVGDDGSVYTSTNATAWTAQTMPDATFDAESVTYGLGLFVAVGAGASNDEIATSPDGVTWTARTLAAGAVLNSVSFADGLFVAVGLSGVILTSHDGVTWTARTSPLSVIWRMVRYFAREALWVVAGGNSVIVSLDGVTWVERSTPASGTRNLSDVAVSESLILISSTFINIPSIYSADGVTWFNIDFPTGFQAYGLILTQDGDIWAFGEYNTSATVARSIAISEYEVYSTLADLEDDTLAPAQGTAKYIAHASGTYVRLGSSPAGVITADVTEGATAADRTAGQLFVRVLEHAGYTSGDWSAADITALDTADDGVCGVYLETGGNDTVAEVLDALAQSVGAWWTVDALGVFRIQQLTAPSGSSTFTITDNDIKGRLDRVTGSDPLRGLPSYRTTLRYAKNYAVQTDGVAGAVSPARRLELSREWREVVSTDTAVQTAHLLAQATVEDTLYASQADAQAEATRRQTLRGTQRSAFVVRVPSVDYGGVALGAVGTLQHPRFGLSAGVLVRVLGVEPDARDRSVTLTLWK
jgi:hypothetical protein